MCQSRYMFKNSKHVFNMCSLKHVFNICGNFPCDRILMLCPRVDYYHLMVQQCLASTHITPR